MSERRPTVLRWQIGDVTVARVEERVVALPPNSLLPPEVVHAVEAERPWIDPFVADDGRILLSLHSFVVVGRGATIVVDTCVGGHGERPLPSHPEFLDRLESAIVGGCAAVDVVVCTHLHFDHVGWNTVLDPTSGALVPTFPHARYLVSTAELATLAVDDPHGIGPLSIEPLRRDGLLQAVAPDHAITDEVRLVPTPGHTPGHVSVVIESAGATGLITGDAIHHPVQLAHPHLTPERFDADSFEAVATRRRLIERYLGTGTLVLGTHFPPPVAGRIVRGRRGVEFAPAADPLTVPPEPPRPSTEPT